MLKRMPLVVALLFGLSLSAHATETLDSALKKVDKLRDAFGDQYVSALTNLSPDQYKAARDRALQAADKAGDNTFSRDDARKELCAGLENAGPNCENAKSGDDLAISDDDDEAPAVSGVEKHAEVPAPQPPAQPSAAIDPQATGDSVSRAEANEAAAEELATGEPATNEAASVDSNTDPAVAQALKSDQDSTPSDSAERDNAAPSREVSSVPQSETDPAI